MPRIETLGLNVCDPIAQRRFYCETLGMREFGGGVISVGHL